MSDFDPVTLDTYKHEENVAWGIDPDAVPQLVANELRRIYDEHGDPGLYFLIMRAEELEQL